jgi:UPF0716 protein FxsA
MVLPLLGLLLLVVPIAELAVLITVAGEIGILETIGLLIVVSMVGAWLCKREGLGVFRRIQAALDRGELPHREVVDGGLILFAGALLLTPGFLTDVLGLLLLLPPTRAVFRRAFMGAVRRRSRVITVIGGVRNASSRYGARPATALPPIDTTESDRPS